MKDNNTNPIISIIVPVYNTATQLPRCIDSILRQTFEKIEVILVDDGSTDNSGTICDEYKKSDDRIKVIHKENGGLGSTRVAGIMMATGSYVGFVDSDDWIDENMYYELTQVMSDRDADIVVGGYLIEKSGKSTCTFEIGADISMDNLHAAREMFASTQFNWSLCDKLYKRSLFLETGILSQWPKGYGEDSYVNWKLLLHTKNVFYHPLYAYHYVMNESSMMHQKMSKDKFEYFRIYNEIYNDIMNNFDDLLFSKFVTCVLTACIPIISIAEENYNKYAEEIISGLKQLHLYVSKIDELNLEIEDNALLKRLDRVSRERQVLEKERQQRDEELIDNCSGKEVFLYGAGTIAEEVIHNLDELQIDVKGIIVSRKEKDAIEVWGKRLYSVDEFINENSSALIILAMNKMHSTEVQNNLNKYRKYDLFNAGKYSLYYE